VDFSVAGGRLVEKIRAFKPEVVMTFGLDGGLNTHPDHTMVASLTSAAFHWAGLEKRYPDAGPVHEARRLYVASTDYFMEDRPEPAPSPWTVKLDVRSVLGRKMEAFKQHASQAPLMERTREMFAEHGAYEYYTLAATRGTGPAAVGDSLFEGLTR
jgi:LmbE family N-acetylglucosaminyl deacetylase